jgi:hypothetical protein
VCITCNEKGSGQFFGLSPNNLHNSDVLLRIVEEVSPDIVHVQYEPGLYGLVLDPINPRNTNTNIDLFYNKCEVPIVTTFHSAYTFRQWLSLVPRTNEKDRNSTVQSRILLETHFEL